MPTMRHSIAFLALANIEGSFGMSVMYLHLDYEGYKALEEQCRAFRETTHKSTGGFYHKSLRVKMGTDLIVEFHGPLVGGYGHNETIEPSRAEAAARSLGKAAGLPELSMHTCISPNGDISASYNSDFSDDAIVRVNGKEAGTIPGPELREFVLMMAEVIVETQD